MRVIEEFAGDDRGDEDELVAQIRQLPGRTPFSNLSQPGGRSRSNVYGSGGGNVTRISS